MFIEYLDKYVSEYLFWFVAMSHIGYFGYFLLGTWGKVVFN